MLHIISEEVLVDFIQPPVQYWTRASEIIDEFNEYGGGPEEEEEIACDELEKMTELLETEEIPWEPRKELLEEVLDFIRMDNSGFSDMLTDVVRSMCRTKEEKIYLADLLSQSKGYYGNWASRWPGSSGFPVGL